MGGGGGGGGEGVEFESAYNPTNEGKKFSIFALCLINNIILLPLRMYGHVPMKFTSKNCTCMIHSYYVTLVGQSHMHRISNHLLLLFHISSHTSVFSA